eukprot:symbB.v1.2.021955.t1/scaffold1926.1/size95923/11
MTAHTVLLAQTKVGFLTGGRKKYFLALPEDEQMVQLEEAYARATVAITRARALCLIMGPLDMKGFLGAATVMGTLMYGAGHVWAGHAHLYLHDFELSRSPPDETFIDMLKQNCCLSGPHFPPPAIVEALQDYEALALFGLREDELLPDLRITREGVLRIGLGAHQEHRVNHEARAADRTKVSAEVIQLAAHEVDPEPDKAESDGGTSDSEGSESASDSEQNDPPSSLAADAEQYVRASYVAVGKDFHDQEDLIGSEYSKLQKLELVPERWPLARLSFSLQKCVDHLGRVLAGCCWEVQATRVTPPESFPSLHQVAKWLTMQLAVYLAKEVAAILRAVLTHDTKKLYNDGTVHLLCSNYWIQPIYQELLHSSSRYNATREGERKRPSSGLARVAAHPRPPKKRKPSASGASFCDWIGGICHADTLQVWFPAHWAPVVLQQLQQKEDSYRAEKPSWMDQEEAPADILKQWQEARANRRMQFKVGNYRDGDWESNIRMLTGTIKADWIQLPVERKKYDVQSMWGDLDPQWRLLKSQLETKGPGWYSPAEREERLFTNKSNRPGDDMKEALRTDGNTAAWQA